MRVLDLFCGAGGAAYGYSLAGFEDITGLDIHPQPRYPFAFIQTDALAYVAQHGHEYDFIHASPPCQRFSYCTPAAHKQKHPDLLEATRTAVRSTGNPYVIENVAGARRKLRQPFMLCGSMFGLSIWRHRYFESPSIFGLLPNCQHDCIPVLITGTTRRKGYPRRDTPVAVRRAAMQCLWMTLSELDEAIPPVYTKWIGEQWLRSVRRDP